MSIRTISLLRSAFLPLATTAVALLLAPACKPSKPAVDPETASSSDAPADDTVEPKRKEAYEEVKAIGKLPATSVDEMQAIVEKHKAATAAIDAYEDAAKSAGTSDAAAPEVTKLRERAEQHLLDKSLAAAEAMEKSGNPLDALQAVIFAQRRQWRPDYPLEKQDFAERYAKLETEAIAFAKTVLARDKSYAAVGGFVATKPIAPGEAAQTIAFIVHPTDKTTARVYFGDTLKGLAKGKKIEVSSLLSCYTEAAAKSAKEGESTAVTDGATLDTSKWRDKKYVEFPVSLGTLVKEGIGLCNVAATAKVGDGGTPVEADGIWVVFVNGA